MVNRTEQHQSTFTAPLAMPAWAASMRLTKEQLAAAERTREYHVGKLQRRIAERARSEEDSSSYSEQ